jgi:hypothetical protein
VNTHRNHGIMANESNDGELNFEQSFQRRCDAAELLELAEVTFHEMALWYRLVAEYEATNSVLPCVPPALLATKIL